MIALITKSLNKIYYKRILLTLDLKNDLDILNIITITLSYVINFLSTLKFRTSRPRIFLKS